MNKIIKIVLISALLPLISGCSNNFKEFFKDTPETEFQITLNGGVVIKCSHGEADSPADNASVLLENAVKAATTAQTSGILNVFPSDNGGDNGDMSINYNDMMKSAFNICNHVTGSSPQPTESAETQKN